MCSSDLPSLLFNLEKLLVGVAKGKDALAQACWRQCTEVKWGGFSMHKGLDRSSENILNLTLTVSPSLKCGLKLICLSLNKSGLPNTFELYADLQAGSASES